MTLPDKADIVRRFDDVGDQLDVALAFARLLVDLRDDDAPRLVGETQKALAALQEGREALQIFAGRQALRQARQAEIGCAVLLRQLAERDRAISPASLRRCLRQQPGRGPHEIASLLGFYLHLDRDSHWSDDRVDKVDLLITELSQRLSDSQAGPGSQRFSQILAAHPTTDATITDLELTNFRRNLAAIESEVEAADSLSQLIDCGTLKKYRNLKHRLGHLLLHPDVLSAAIETNQALQRRIQRLNSRTLTGIFSIYQAIFDTGLKGGIDPELQPQIDQLHLDFDRFESRVKRDEIRLTELEEFWTTLTKLAARLDEAAAEETTSQTPAAPVDQQLPVTEEAAEDWLTEDVMALLDLLRENDRKGWPAEYVTFSPGEEFQLDPREIVAFRRLSDAAPIDRALEMFLLKAAALRRSIKRSARKLTKTSDAEISRELPVFAIAQQAVRLAESFLARYSQAVGQAILDGDVSEAQQLQILRMRLVRESAGVWLQVHRPT